MRRRRRAASRVAEAASTTRRQERIERESRTVSQQHTDVYQLDTIADLLQLCRRLLSLKRLAPRSLRYTVAVTATRNVSFRGPKNAKPDITKRISD